MQAQVLAVEGEGAVEVAAGDTSSDAKPVDNQGTASPGMYNPNVCWRCGQVGHCEGLPYSRHPADQSFG